jgi:hypothetical protein
MVRETLAEFGLHVSNVNLVTKNEALISVGIIIVMFCLCVDLYIMCNERITIRKRNIL